MRYPPARYAGIVVVRATPRATASDIETALGALLRAVGDSHMTVRRIDPNLGSDRQIDLVTIDSTFVTLFLLLFLAAGLGRRLRRRSASALRGGVGFLHFDAYLDVEIT
jgi:hypothetical protein